MKVNKVKRAIIAAFAAVFAFVAPAVAADIVLPNGIDTSSYQENNTVYDGTTYYSTLQKAVEGVCGNDGAILYCKPGADVGSLQHAPVTATLTIYGNGASVSGGSERDFDIGNTDPNGGRDITADMTLTVKGLNGCGAWGNKATAHTVNLVFEDCQNMGKVFITGTTGTLNITIKDSSFEGVIKEAVYSNADGTITLNNVDFSNLTKAVNLNHKAVGTQTVTITDCTFTNCGSDVSKDEIPVRVLSSVDGGKSVLTVSGTTFTGTPEGGADILLPESVGVTEVAISTTAASVSHKGEMISVKEDESYSNQAPAVAKIGDVEFTNFADALAAAKAMTGSVTVEIYEKVTLCDSLYGNYNSITFVGKDTDAEIYLDVQGYTTATGKTVNFNDLKLSKSVGGYIANAGFMNLAFGVYDVDTVNYTKCTFLNGAYASSGAVTFSNCTFYRSHDRYGLWAYGAQNIVVDGCTFSDIRGIKMYDEGKFGTTSITVKNTSFTAVTDKPAIVLTYGNSVTLEKNTYGAKGTFELDLDGKPNGVTVTSDVPPTCVNDNGACGVLVDGKIYTTVAQAAEVATANSTVTLLHNSAETVELPEGVTLNRNGFTADGVTVKQPAKNIEVTDANGNVTYYAGFTGFSDLDLADCTIKLLNNVSDANLILNKGSTSKIVDTNVTLDLNGYTFSRTGSSSGAINLTNGAGLTIRDSSDAKTGKILVDTYAIWMMNGDFVLESGTIETTSTKNAAIYANAAKVDIKAGEIISAGNAITVGENFMESRGASTIAISGGEIVAAGVGIKNGSYAQDSTAVTVTGGKIDSEGDSINMEKGSAQVSGGTFSSDVSDYCVDGYESKQNADGTYGVAANPAYGKVAKIGDNYYATLADALTAAKEAGLTDVVITLIGDTVKTTTDSFNLPYTTIFDNVTFKQADATKTYYLYDLYTGVRTNGGKFIFDGVNIVVTDQYMFEGDVELINNSTITSKADANCFVYYANVTIEPGSKLNGVIDDIRGGTLTVDGGKTDGTVNSTPDLQDAFLHVNWADSKLVVKNGAYAKINSVNEIGKLTVNGTVEVLNAKLEVLQEIAISQNASMKVDVGSEINAGKITGAGKIIVDAAGMSVGDEISLTANLANFTGMLETVGNDDLEACIVDGKIVLSAKPVAKIGDTPYATLADALAAAQTGDTVELLSNVVVGSYETNKFENVSFAAINGAEMTIEANGEVQFIGSDLTNVKIIGAGTTRFYNTVNFYGANNVLSAINGTPFDLIVNKQSTLFISRFVLGYNRNITVYGDIEDASTLTASDITGMTPSLKFNSTSGVSVGGTDVGNLIVKDAYIELGNSSWKNAYGTYDWNFTNSYVSATSLFNAAAGGTSVAKWNVTFDDCVLSAKNYIKNGVGVTINFYNGSVATTGSMRIDGELNIDKTSSVSTTLQQNNVVGKVDEHGGINGTVNVEGVLTIGSNARTQLEVLGGKINIKGGTLNLGNNTLTLDGASEMTSSGDVTGAIVVADGALVSLTGGTYTQDVKDWCAEGYLCAEQNSDPVLWKVGRLPSAEVVNLGPVEVGSDGDYTFGDNYYVYDLVGTQKMTTSSDPFDLQIALNFIAKDTVAQAEKNAFGNYTTDFYITIDGIKDGSFVADENCYLAGYYPLFNAWVKIPLTGFKIEDRKVYPVITSAGFDFKYTDICGSVGDFICGIHLSDAVLQANPALKVKLELGLSKTYDDALAANKFVGVDQPYEYDVEDMTSAVAVTGPDYYTTVESAIAVALETGDFVKLVKDSKLEENLTLAKNLDFNLGGNTLSANGKSLAIGNTYVAITNGTLAGFTSANITLTGNAVLTVTDKNVADSFRTSVGHYVSQNANGTYSIMLKSAFRVFITMVDGEPRIGFFKDFAMGSAELKLVAATNLEKPDWQAVAYVEADDAAGASTLPLYWVKLNQAADDANVYRFFKLAE